ncbi:hypothetical protein TWF788_003255 [Orbilia oligospora]|uniref:Phytocyanin domain-containing protein n=1 Tax=Orbilia oligospora TaxID=2813651 RepID=A0A7C8Q0V0_ORBOL|nr:hypothetical protein TWF788_003255 [Orbilia oligospora]
MASWIKKVLLLALATGSSYSMAQSPDQPNLCFSNPMPRWDINKAYNISTTFQKDLCQVIVTFSDQRFPALFFTTVTPQQVCGNGEINQIMIPQAAPNGKAIIEQMCPFLAQKLCIGIMIEGGLEDPDAFAEMDQFTKQRLCADKTFPLDSTRPSTSSLALINTQTETVLTKIPKEISSYSSNFVLSTPSPSGATPFEPTTFITAMYTSSRSTSASKTQKTHTVHLDYGENAFNPNKVLGDVGDVVQFFFLSPGHTIVETSLEDPCTPAGGFESGSETRPDLVSGGRHFNNTISFTITALNSRYFGCGQPEHCLSGMVFAINAEEPRFSQFLKNIPSQARVIGSSTTTPTVVATQVLALESNNSPTPTICSVCPSSFVSSTLR